MVDMPTIFVRPYRSLFAVILRAEVLGRCRTTEFLLDYVYILSTAPQRHEYTWCAGGNVSLESGQSSCVKPQITTLLD